MASNEYVGTASRWMGPTLADGTPLRSVSGLVPLGYDPLKESGVRDTLIWRGWKVDGAQLQKEWLIHIDADRVALREDAEDVLATIGADDNIEFTYIAPGTDAGFAQIGCAVYLVSAVIGALIGVMVVLILARSFNPGAGVIGILVGFAAGMFASSEILKIALSVRRWRSNAESMAYVAAACISGILAAIVTLLFGLISAQGRSVG